MRYQSGEVSKYDYACMTAAGLAYLILHQQDSVGLVTFDDQIRQFLRPSSQPSHLKEIAQVLNSGPAQQKTRLGAIFHELAERINRRGLVFVFSDLFDDVAGLMQGLQHLRYDRHEVVVFHVLDPAELDFPFQEATLFRGLEEMPDLLTDPRSLRRSYLNQFRAFLAELQQGCRGQNMDYVQLRTDSPLGVALSSYLGRRLAQR